MSRLSCLVVGLLLFLTLVMSTFSPVTAQSNQTANEKRQLTRGKYLVERVGMCADCHSPGNERGEFIRARWLGVHRSSSSRLSRYRFGRTWRC